MIVLRPGMVTRRTGSGTRRKATGIWNTTRVHDKREGYLEEQFAGFAGGFNVLELRCGCVAATDEAGSGVCTGHSG